VKKIDQMLKDWRKEQAEAKGGKYTVTHNSPNLISKDSEFTGEYTQHYGTSFRYLCLPDTIDPRIVKGK
jgi:hypothetical protein